MNGWTVVTQSLYGEEWCPMPWIGTQTINLRVFIYDSNSSGVIGAQILRATKEMNPFSCQAYQLTYGSLP